MTDDTNERLVRLETQREHDHQLNSQLSDDVDKLEDGQRETATRTTKLESKVNVIWVALGTLASLVGAAVFNFLSKGGNP